MDKHVTLLRPQAHKPVRTIRIRIHTTTSTRQGWSVSPTPRSRRAAPQPDGFPT